MTQKILLLGLFSGVVLLTCQALHAQSVGGGQACAAHAQVVARLAARYGETRQAMGLAGTEQMVELYAAPETGSWSLLVTDTSGRTCLMAAGQAFERIGENLAPIQPEDPA